MIDQDDVVIVCEDGYSLAATQFQHQSSDAIGVVLINSATGVTRAFYQPFAKYLVNQGFVVITYDYRGIGDSLHTPIQAFDGFMHQWGTHDLTAVIDWIHSRFPQLPLNCVGHSVGAQLVGLTPRHEKINTLISIGGQKGYWRFWQGKHQLKMALCMFVLIPIICRVKQFFPGKLLGSTDLPKFVAREWASWCRHKSFIKRPSGFLEVTQFSNFRGDAYFYSFYDDHLFAPRKSVDGLAAMYTKASTVRTHIEADQVNGRAIGHFGFFRSSFRKTLWLNTFKLLAKDRVNEEENIRLAK